MQEITEPGRCLNLENSPCEQVFQFNGEEWKECIKIFTIIKLNKKFLMTITPLITSGDQCSLSGRYEPELNVTCRETGDGSPCVGGNAGTAVLSTLILNRPDCGAINFNSRVHFPFLSLLLFYFFRRKKKKKKTTNQQMNK